MEKTQRLFDELSKWFYKKEPEDQYNFTNLIDKMTGSEYLGGVYRMEDFELRYDNTPLLYLVSLIDSDFDTESEFFCESHDIESSDELDDFVDIDAVIDKLIELLPNDSLFDEWNGLREIYTECTGQSSKTDEEIIDRAITHLKGNAGSNEIIMLYRKATGDVLYNIVELALFLNIDLPSHLAGLIHGCMNKTMDLTKEFFTSKTTLESLTRDEAIQEILMHVDKLKGLPDAQLNVVPGFADIIRGNW